MANLKGSRTEQNLKDAFAGESQANRRYLYFAAKADVEGYNDVSAVFRSTAEGETGHAHGHLEYLEAVGDPATGLPIPHYTPNTHFLPQSDDDYFAAADRYLTVAPLLIQRRAARMITRLRTLL